jgi:hypothetical protein
MEEIRLARAAAQEVAGTVTSISLMVYYHQRGVNTFAKLLQKDRHLGSITQHHSHQSYRVL